MCDPLILRNLRVTRPLRKYTRHPDMSNNGSQSVKDVLRCDFGFHV